MANPVVNDTFSAKNITSAATVYTWTVPAGTTGTVQIQVFLDNAAGGGDYVFYLSKQIGGAGSEYLVLPKTTVTSVVGETAFSPPTIPYDVVAGDVIKFYVDGLAGDTSVNGKIKIFVPTVNLVYILGTALTESVAGYLATAFKKLFDVAAPVFTLASVNQTGDSYAVETNATYGLSAIHTDVGNIPTNPELSGAAAAALTAYDPPTKTEMSAEHALLGTLANQATILSRLGTAVDLVTTTIFGLLNLLYNSLINHTSLTSSINSGKLTIRRGDTLSQTIAVTSVAGYDTIDIAVKINKNDNTDAQALVWIRKKTGGTDGLQRLNGSAATASKGSITVNSNTSLTINLDADQTAQLSTYPNIFFDVQRLIGSNVKTVGEGPCEITADVARAVS